MLFTIIIGSVIVLLFLRISYNRYKIDKSLKGFVSPPGLPLFGHLFLFSSELNFLPGLLDIIKKYGNFLKMEFFYGMPVLVVTDKDFIAHILSVKPLLEKDILYKFGDGWTGDGLLTCDGKKWKQTRRIMNPAFNVQLLEKYVESFSDPCKILIEKLKSQVGNRGFDVMPHVSLCTLDIICETIMGIKVKAQEDKHSQYIQDIHDIVKIVLNRLTSPLKRFRPTFMLTGDYRRKCAIVARNQILTKEIIAHRKQIRSKGNNSDDAEEVKEINYLLDVLLDAHLDGRPMTHQEIMFETQTFLFAGHDTVATAVTFCLYCLSKHPDVQGKVFEELKAIFDSDKRYPTWSDLNQMQYLEIVVKETMRCHTPTPFISRIIDEDIQFGDKFAPKGIPIIIFLQGLHVNPAYHPDPDKFDPSRFENETKTFAFIPFGGGPRNCIGQRFAMLEAKYLLSQIIRNFVILPVDGHIPQRTAQILLRFKNGAMIKLKLR